MAHKVGVKTPSFVEQTTNNGNALEAKGYRLGHKVGVKTQSFEERQTIVMFLMPKYINWDTKLGVKTPSFAEGTTNDGNGLKAKGYRLGHKVGVKTLSFVEGTTNKGNALKAKRY